MTSEAVSSPEQRIDVGWRTLRLLTAYLGASAIPVLYNAINNGGSRGAITAALHLSVLAALAGVLTARKTTSDLAAWIPLVLWPALYAEIPIVIAGLGGSMHDRAVQGWDAAIFGAQPARAFAAALPNRALSEILHAGYLSYYALIYVPPALLFARGKRDEFARTVFALTVVWLVCLVGFVAFPVAGPRYEWGLSAAVPSGAVRSTVLWVLETGSARGTAFPSSHVAVAVVQSAVALEYQRRVGWIATVATVLLGCGAVYGGFHYAVDVIAGAAVGLSVVVALTATIRAPQ